MGSGKDRREEKLTDLIIMQVREFRGECLFLGLFRVAKPFSDITSAKPSLPSLILFLFIKTRRLTPIVCRGKVGEWLQEKFSGSVRYGVGRCWEE